MKLVELSKGFTSESDVLYAQVQAVNNGETRHVFCIEANEMQLYVSSDKSILEIWDELESDSEIEYEITSCNADGQVSVTKDIFVDLEEILAYCMESNLEHYECYDGDISDSADMILESENATLFAMCYDFMKTAFLPRSESDDKIALLSQYKKYQDVESMDLEELLS